MAQDQDQDQETETDQPVTGNADIIVTAQRREGNLQSVPIAVSAVSQEALGNFQATETADLQRVVPGLRLLPVTSNPSNFQVSLRGSIQQDSSLVVAESPVGFYVDDIYIARLNGANAQLADIERVEVLRGPQGTLYGRNTLAGAVRLITTTPSDDFDFRASASYGDFNSYQLSGLVSGPLGDSGFAASVAGITSGTDGYYTNIADGSDWGEQRNYGVRGKLRFDNGSPFTAELLASYASSDNDGYVPSFALFPMADQSTSDEISFGLGDPYLVNFAPNPALPGPIESQPRGETEQLILGATLAYEFGDITAKSITALVETEDFFSIEFTGVGAFPGANRSDTSQFTQELQLQGESLDGALNWLVGAYYFDESAEQVVALISNDLLLVDTQSVSLFANADFEITPNLGLTVGGRWTRDEKDFSGTIRGFDLMPLLPAVELSETYSAFTPKFGINYQVEPSGALASMLLYASVGRGFKSGGFNGIAFGNIDVLRTAYEPETNWTYEIGVKTDLFDRRVRLNAAAYINDVNDVTMTALLSGPSGVSFPVQNAGDTQITGLELELSVVPIPGLTLFGNATFQDGEYTELNPTSAAAQAAATFGEAFVPQIADLTYTVGFNWEIPSPIQGNADILLGANYYHTDDYFIGASNDFIIDGFNRANAYVGYRINDQLDFRLEVTNLNDGVDINTGASIFSAVAVEPPRQFMFTVSYRN